MIRSGALLCRLLFLWNLYVDAAPRTRVLEYGNTLDDSLSLLRAKSRQTLILHSTQDDLTLNNSGAPCDNATSKVVMLEEDVFFTDMSNLHEKRNEKHGPIPLLTSLLAAAVHFRPKHDSEYVTEVIIVANGFDVSENAASTLYALLEDSFVSLSVVLTRDFVGYAAGLNLALEYINSKQDDWSHSSRLIAIMDTSLSLSVVNPGMARNNNIFDVYRDLASQYGAYRDDDSKRHSLVAYKSPGTYMYQNDQLYRWTRQAPMPAMIMDVAHVANIRKEKRHPWRFFDDKYYFQYSMVDFIDNLSSPSLIAVDSTQDLLSSFQAEISSETANTQSFVKALGLQRNCTTSILSDRQELLQEDIDLYFVTSHLSVNRRSLAALDKSDHSTFSLTSSLISGELAPSPDLLQSLTKGLPFKVTAVVCVYDDTRFMEQLLLSLLPSLHHVIILMSTSPWNSKPARSTSHTLSTSHFLASTPEGKDKVSIIQGTWHNESQQRNFGNRIAMELGTDLVMVMDGDEFWHPVQLERSFSLIAQNINGIGLPPFVRSKMTTHFGSLLSIVDPPERLQILWLVSPTACHFTFAREVECFAGRGTSNDGLLLSPEISQCAHLSYVRTTEEIVSMKFASFEHHDEIDTTFWIENVWLKWKLDPRVENLHPTHSTAYKRTRSIQVLKLPPSLRSFYINCCLYRNHSRLNNDEEEMICSSHEISTSPRLDSSLRKIDTRILAEKVWFQLHKRPSSLPLTLGPSPTGAGEIIFTDNYLLSKNEGKLPKFLRAPSISIARKTVELDPLSLENPESAKLNCLYPRFMILTVKEGEMDNSTEGTFEDVSMILVEGIRKALSKYSNISIDTNAVVAATCHDLRVCQLSGERFVIVLGSHHLSRYTVNNKTHAVVKADFPPRSRSALYNFEFVDRQSDFMKKDLNMWSIFDHYEKSQHGIWDYSVSNHRQIVKEGYNAKHVPLGYVDDLKWEDISVGMRDIDVLFYGFLNEYRSNILSMLRDQGIVVRHANAHTGMYGNDLKQLIQRSKIILNLRYFADESEDPSGEWKMVRFLRPLANAHLIVSEYCGDPIEVNKWDKNGIVFVTASKLSSTLKYYLKNEQEASKIAKRGQKLFQSQREEDILLPFLRDLVHNRCPHW